MIRRFTKLSFVLLISLSTIAVVGCSKKQSSIDESLVNGNDVIGVEIDKTTDITDNIASNEEITSEEITESNTENITDNTTENITEDNSVSESNETEAETAEAEQDKENSGNKEEDIEETTDDKEVKEEKPIESEPVVEKPSVDDKETKKEDKKDTEKDKKDKVENNDKDNIDKDKKEPTATPTPKAEPTKKPTPTPTQKPKPTPTPKPTATPTPEPKPTEEPKPTKAPTNKAKTEKFYGVEIVGVDKFVDPKEGWKNNFEDLSKLGDVLDEKYPDKSGLYIYSSRLEFSHLDSTSPAIILKANNNEYQLVIRARLNVVNEYGIEADAKLNRDMVKIFLMKITPEYETVYKAVYDSAETDNTHGINTKTYTKIGDVMIKVDLDSDEGVVYKIKKAN